MEVFTASIVSVADNYVAPDIDDLESSGARMASLGIWLTPPATWSASRG